jgi:hypothetical protein
MNNMTSNRKTNRMNRKQTINVNELVFQGVSTILDQHTASNWIGTMSDLATALNRTIDRKQRGFLPRSPSALRVVINRVVNRIRNRGVSVRFGRTTDHTRTRFVRFAQ